MSVQSNLERKIEQFEKGKPFSNRNFIAFGEPRAAVDQALYRLVKKGAIQRVSPGIYVSPKTSKYVGEVAPNTAEIIQLIAEKNKETIQPHGAEAARMFKLTTQTPTRMTYLTSGKSRSLTINNQEVQFKHVSNKKLQFAQQKEGLALLALWYLGKENISTAAIEKVRSQLSMAEFNNLLRADVPAWLSEALINAAKELKHG